MALNDRQRRFVNIYAGNAEAAGREVGYGPAQSWRLIQKPEIIEAIRAREAETAARDIATREERQRFWTATMRDESRDVYSRMRASELLGKSFADFTDKVAGADGGPLKATVLVSFVHCENENRS